jgi:hypothetical protein
MKDMPKSLMILVLPMLFAGAWPAAVSAQTSDQFPYSIMQPEPGERRARRPKPAPKQVAPAPKADAPQSAQKAGPRPIRRGSSSASSIPVYRSPVTPLGTAPQVGNVQPLGNPGSPSVPVPGIQGNTGPAMIPARPPGQTNQDRTINCVQSGAASGVSPGQIGSFTQNCVNR